jgi:uncharacterized protein (TIGR03435 family)
MLSTLSICWLVFFGQEFSVASVKTSQFSLGRDHNNQIAISPNGFSARNSTLKRLIVEAYSVQPFRVVGPNWLDANEYDVEARADGSSTPEQIRLMLRLLLSERFGLKIHRESKPLQVYELVVEKGGPKIPTAAGKAAFQGTIEQFCNLLAIKLTIHVMDDPTKPGMAGGPPIPVVDKTGLTGIYEIPSDVSPEPGADMFTVWQRKLHEIGFKLESRKAPVELILVDHAEKAPVSN